jgi:hypothetical protein
VDKVGAQNHEDLPHVCDGHALLHQYCEDVGKDSGSSVFSKSFACVTSDFFCVAISSISPKRFIMNASMMTAE